MENLDAKEIVICREIAKTIQADYQSVYLKVEKNCLKDGEEYAALKEKIESSSDIDSVFENARKLEQIKDNIIFDFAIRNRLMRLIDKNAKRVSKLESAIKAEKLPSIELTPRQIAAKLEDTNLTVSKHSLGLNPKIDGEEYFYFDRRLFKTKFGELDFEFEPNLDALFSEDDRNFEIIMNNFPTSVAKFPSVVMTDLDKRNRVLKYVAVTAYKLFRTMHGYEVNEFFGSPLVISRYQKVDFKRFISEIENLFNIMARDYLRDNFPGSRKFIEEKLIVYPDSEFLPEFYRSASQIEELISSLVEDDIEELIGDDTEEEDAE